MASVPEGWLPVEQKKLYPLEFIGFLAAAQWVSVVFMPGQDAG